MATHNKSSASLPMLRLVKGKHEISDVAEADARLTLMREILDTPPLTEQWLHFSSLSQRNNVQEEDDIIDARALYEESLRWQTSTVDLGERARRTLQQLWTSWHKTFQAHAQEMIASFLVMQSPDLQVRAGLPPVAGFSTLKPDTHQHSFCFTLEQHRNYAFNAYLPAPGYVAVFQVEQEAEELQYQLLYPQNQEQLSAHGAGGSWLFDACFAEAGRTHVLVLYHSESFDSLSPLLWPHHQEQWSWDQRGHQDIANYILAHSDQLHFFSLDIEVQEAD